MEVTNHAATVQFSLKSLTVADFSQELIANFLRKIGGYQARVLQDTEPEALHKMRVGMRRLRTILQVLEPLVVLPKDFSGRSIGKLAKKMGAVRDLDVMKESLQSAGQELPPSEQKILNKIIKSLARRRRPAFAQLEKSLATSYRSIMKAGQQWTRRPRYRHFTMANQSVADVAPDLLLPIIGGFFLHGGWGVLATELDENEAVVHDLRKCTKRIRYQTECFAPCLSNEFTQFLLPLESSQECLGHMQDAAVLRDFIEKKVGGKVSKKMPVLIDRLEQKKEQAWQEWQAIRGQLCDPQWRQSLRRAVL